MTGARIASAWDVKDSPAFDFYDMKGRVELLLAGLRYTDIVYAETSSNYQLHGQICRSESERTGGGRVR